MLQIKKTNNEKHNKIFSYIIEVIINLGWGANTSKYQYIIQIIF